MIITLEGQWVLPDWELPAGESDLTPELDQKLTRIFESARARCPLGRLAHPGEALTWMLDEAVDRALLALHGTYGEDGRIQGFLEVAGIPYTGSGVLASAVAMDKPTALEVFRRAGLKVPQGAQISRGEFETLGEPQAILRRLFPGTFRPAYPLFVKPASGGSSVGTGPVYDATHLIPALEFVYAHDDVALVEEAVKGREISVGVLERTPKRPEALPPTEIVLLGSEFFDYDAKYTPGKCQEVTPAPLEPRTLQLAQNAAVQAHLALGCKGYSRTDMIVTADSVPEVVLLETNTLPGMTPTSILPQQAAAIGISFEDLLDLLLSHAELIRPSIKV